ncbi:MAG: M20/M25/M40 family metallo-hydrolase, partial [Lachnospiraceae bacterium]|nr:M20/M25/M40 family metallo-hydrolase [Lachnospiraceae bacterium]
DEAAQMAAELPDVTVSIVPQVKKAPVQCSGELQDFMEKICVKHSYSYRRMPSGATHDGNSMATKMPIGMIFVPSKDGLSHCKGEFTDWKYVEKGITVMAEMLEILNNQ